MAGGNSTTWTDQTMNGNNFKSITILMFIAAGALAFLILFMVKMEDFRRTLQTRFEAVRKLEKEKNLH